VTLFDWDRDLGNPPNINDRDFVLDFTHLKDFAVWFDSSRYMAYCFATDRMSYKRDVFATNVVKRWFTKRATMLNYDPGPVVYPGIRNIYQYRETKEEYVLFLGRIAPYKGVHIALDAASQAGLPIKVAGHTGRFADPAYVEKVKGLCRETPKAEFIGDVSVKEKVDLLSHAKCLIAPSDWSMLPGSPPESFGIVCVEALLSGTPCIVPPASGMAEIIDQQSGLTASTVDEYRRALLSISDVTSPRACLERGKYFTPGRFWEDLAVCSSFLS